MPWLPRFNSTRQTQQAAAGSFPKIHRPFCMNRETLLAYYERLTGLVEKLPGGLQKPILNELVPIRQLFLEQRPARLLLVGDPQPAERDFLLSILAAHPSPQTDAQVPGTQPAGSGALQLESGDLDNGWRTVALPGKGAVQILDVRAEGIAKEFIEHALLRHQPDAVVLFQGEEGMEAATRFQEAVGLAAQMRTHTPELLLEDEKKKGGTREPVDPPAQPALIAVSTSISQPAGVERLRALVHSRRELAGWNLRVLDITESAEIGAAICAFLPNQARLEFALFGDIRSAQVEIARSLLKSFTAVCGVVGMQPIPLADLPVLTTLQSLMVGLIAYVSGRRLGPRAVAEFSGAVGISFGLGIVFREGARAVIKVVPGFGNAISGMVAGAGTYAIGRAAIAYFIERVPARETKKLFQTIRPKKTTFLRRLPWPRKKQEEPPAE